MKQLLILLLAITLFTACNNNNGLIGGKTKSNWTNKDRTKALGECENEIPDNPQAKQICSCLLEKVEKKYPEPGDVDKKSSKEEIAEMTQACLTGGGDDDNGLGRKKTIDEPGDEGSGWSKSDRNGFLSPCGDGLTGKGYSSAQASKLCNCALGKLEKKYSSLQDANDRGGEAAGAKVMQECLGGERDDNNDDN